MRTLLLLFCTVSFISFGHYLKPETVTKSENHLLEINENWNTWKDRINSEVISFQSDVERIQYHLLQVIDLLNENSDNFNGKQLENRESLIESLTGYAQKGVFPTNHHHSARRPYFVDNFGVHCAVGYLMVVSGHEELVQRIRKEHNFDYIKDIKTEGVVEWTKEFGFSIEELKLIQPGYQAPRSLVSVGEGTNGEVKEMVRSSSDGSLIFGGNFSEVNGLPCANIGVYQNDQLSCFNSGVEGVVNDISTYWNLSQNEDIIYAVGSFTSQGIHYPIAQFINGQKEFVSIPQRPNAIGLNVLRTNSFLYVSIRENESSSQSEVWELNPMGEWRQMYLVDGIFTDIVSVYSKIAFIGSFDSVEVFNQENSEIFYVNNAVLFDTYSFDNEFIQNPNLSDTIFAVHQIGSVLYLAGSCGVSPDLSDACLTRYSNGEYHTLITSTNLSTWGQSDSDYFAIKSLYNEYYPETGLMYLGGRFNAQSGMYSGRNFAQYNPLSNRITPLDVLNGEVNKIFQWNNNIYLGGNFPSSIYDDLNYLARYEPNLVLVDNIENPTISVYPNPFENQLTIDGVSDNSTFEIVQMNGQIIRKGEISNGKINQLEDLPKGIYLLKIQSEGVEKTMRITK